MKAMLLALWLTLSASVFAGNCKMHFIDGKFYQAEDVHSLGSKNPADSYIICEYLGKQGQKSLYNVHGVIPKLVGTKHDRLTGNWKADYNTPSMQHATCLSPADPKKCLFTYLKY